MQRPSIIQDGFPQGGTIQLTGPFGGPRTAVYVSEGARVLDIYVVHPGRLTADIWARIWPWGASEDLRGPQKGASGAETGTFGVSRNVVDAPEVLRRPWEPKRLWLVPYLIIVISFTLTRFLELKIYTQVRVNQDKLDFATK